MWQAIEVYAASNRARLANGTGRVRQGALADELGVKAPDLSAIKLLEVREIDERLNRLEAIVLGQKVLAEPIFDIELIGGDFSADLVDE